MVDNTALLCTPGVRLPKCCWRDGHGALLSVDRTLCFLLICSTRQSLLNLLSPTRNHNYIYRRREEHSTAPTWLPCSLSGMGIAVICAAEGKHVATADKKPYAASWELHCKHPHFYTKFSTC